ncbi:hypothetical protein A2U01_0015322 [Trifolium medium]|uniref:Uncharacterized protein n=1 Tax=Trifolium medium TaxID=97028 RepID=A0A392N793_9FABA|nr:hypothetical protein [Trifolium medium]
MVQQREAATSSENQRERLAMSLSAREGASQDRTKMVSKLEAARGSESARQGSLSESGGQWSTCQQTHW